jgi:glycerol-3-phosphate dehydrogenase subunit C
MSKIPRTPLKPPTYDPDDSRFWDERDLETEVRRTFQVCHECRMCVTYCGSFPSLFGAVDREIDSGRAEGAETVNLLDIAKVSNLCWQCKLCYINCPYTPDEKAYEALDFPRLMAREKIVRARRNGIPLVDKILGEPQLVGAAGAGPQAAMANLVNANRLVRKVTEKITGISAEFPLPKMASRSFASWLEDHQPLPGAGEAGTVVIFSTCYGDFNYPNVPRAAVRVLEHHGFRVIRPEQTCCGMPNLDGGDVEGLRGKARENVASILPHVRAGAKVVTPGPTCGYTIKKEWPEYLRTREASEVAAATLDLMEMLEKLRREKKLKKEFSRGFGKIAYHAPCHLRAQKIGTPGARILGLLPDTDVEIVAECSAVDGTWGMKAEHYEMGRSYAQKLVRAVRDVEPKMVVSDCTLAGLRIGHENAVEVFHPIEALAMAYGLDFEQERRPGADESTAERRSKEA